MEGREEATTESEKRPGGGFVWLFLVGNHDTFITGMLRTPVFQMKGSSKKINMNNFSVANRAKQGSK